MGRSASINIRRYLSVMSARSAYGNVRFTSAFPASLTSPTVLRSASLMSAIDGFLVCRVFLFFLYRRSPRKLPLMYLALPRNCLQMGAPFSLAQKFYPVFFWYSPRLHRENLRPFGTQSRLAEYPNGTSDETPHPSKSPASKPLQTFLFALVKSNDK